PDASAARAVLADAQAAAGDGLAELRRVVRSIAPPVLDQQGLDAAVTALAAGLPIPCRVDTAAVRASRAPLVIESSAYHAIAECMTNIARHSHATAASVTLATRAGVLVLEGGDNGGGGAREGPGGRLAGLRDRRAG